MKRIALIGPLYESNLGDPLLFDCTEYICKQIEKESNEYIKLDILAREKIQGHVPNIKYKKYPLSYRVWNRIYSRYEKFFSPIKVQEFRNNQKKWQFEHSEFKTRLIDYFEKNFQNVDLVLFVGAGTIKWHVRLDFGPIFGVILECAKKRNIPCAISGAGIESEYNDVDSRSLYFSNVLSDNIWKIIATRDDIESLRKYVKSPNIEIAKISDLGVWSAETYGVKADENSTIVGIGIICPNRFVQYGSEITEEEYDKTIIQMIEYFENKRIEWRLFTNGDVDDIKYFNLLCGKLKLKDDNVCRIPKTPKELVQLISQFKGVIVSRMHSSIIAYSLNIPFVSIAWNRKLMFFNQNIGYPERVFDKSNLDYKNIVKTFEYALKEGYDQSRRRAFRESSFTLFERLLNDSKHG